MYIPDEKWDQMINESCDIVTAISYLVSPKENETNPEILKRKNLFYSCSGMLQAFINLENKPIALSQIKNVDESKYFIIKWALKQLFTFKRKSRNCRKSR
jgi:hypothetical protein